MKQWIVIIIATILIFGCQAKKETMEDAADGQMDIAIEQLVVTSLIVDEEIGDAVEIEPTQKDEYDPMADILAEYGRLLSGSWTQYPDRVNGLRELSWGIVPFAKISYTLIDFIAVPPIYIMGPIEGGPDGIDSLYVEVEKIEIESPGIFRIYYVDNSSGYVPQYGDLAFSYDSENDTISYVDFGGWPFISHSIRVRVSERLE